MQRIWWALTEGLAATGLVYAGRFIDPSDPNSGLKALRALSMCVGLPYTFLVCYMCVALWRTLRYELGLAKWSDGFKLSVLDIGITFYSVKPRQEGVCVNMKQGKFDKTRLLEVAKCCFVPYLALLAVFEGLETKTEQRTGKRKYTQKRVMINAVLAAILLFYPAWLLIFLDPVPMEKNSFVSEGKWNDATTRDEWVTYDLSSRYGYFRKHTNDWESGQVLQLDTSYKADRLETMGIGDRIGPNMHLQVFGWFFYFLFLAIVAGTRSDVRAACGVGGTFIEDILATFFLWPTVLVQMKAELEQTKSPKVALVNIEHTDAL